MLHQLDTSVGASGPHDFAVREHAPSSEAPLASTASRLTSVTIAKRPSERRDARNMDLIWVERETEYFFGWDWTGEPSPAALICPSGRSARRIGGAQRYPSRDGRAILRIGQAMGFASAQPILWATITVIRTVPVFLQEQNNDSDGDGAKPKCHDTRAVK